MKKSKILKHTAINGDARCHIAVGIGISREQAIPLLAEVYCAGLVGDRLVFGLVGSKQEFKALLSCYEAGGIDAAKGFLDAAPRVLIHGYDTDLTDAVIALRGMS